MTKLKLCVFSSRAVAPTTPDASHANDKQLPQRGTGKDEPKFHTPASTTWKPPVTEKRKLQLSPTHTPNLLRAPRTPCAPLAVPVVGSRSRSRSGERGGRRARSPNPARHRARSPNPAARTTARARSPNPVVRSASPARQTPNHKPDGLIAIEMAVVNFKAHQPKPRARIPPPINLHKEATHARQRGPDTPFSARLKQMEEEASQEAQKAIEGAVLRFLSSPIDGCHPGEDMSSPSGKRRRRCTTAYMSPTGETFLRSPIGELPVRGIVF